MRTVHVVISGRVQGVGFRAFVVRDASALHLTGWVRNRRDGRVEAVLQGSSEAVADMIERCRRGPRFSEVEGIMVDDRGDERFASFSVHPTA